VNKRGYRRLSIVVTVFFLLSILVAGVEPAFAQAPDIKGHWAEKQITEWVNKGLARGYPDGSFKPNNQITRAEFVALLNRAFGKQDPAAKAAFKDVNPSDWFYAEVAAADAAGYCAGYADGTFRPRNPITRQEVASIMARLLQLDTGVAQVTFKDTGTIAAWAKGSVNAVAGARVMGGYADGTFKAANPITRAEAVVTLDRLSLAVNPAPEGITGTVTLNGEAVEGAVVLLFAENGTEPVKETTSGKDGEYAFRVDAGSYDITAAKDKYVAYAAGVSFASDGTVQDLALAEGTLISGRLVDKNGSAVKNARLFFTTNPTFLTTTDGSGDFSIYVPAGKKYTVRGYKNNKPSSGLEIVADNIQAGPAGNQSIGSIRTSYALSTPGGGGGGAPGSPATYTLTLTANPAIGGTVTDNTNAGPYTAGTTVSVTAAADNGYQFVNWTVGGDEVSTDATFNFTMPAANTTLVANFAPEAPSDFAGGSGTEADPYRVATAVQLNRVRDYPDKRFVQTADIDLSGYSSGEGWEPIIGFTGFFDGGGYTISNLTINRPETNDVGLFGTSAGTITNASLISVNVIGMNNVGGLVGDNAGGVITNSSVAGNVIGNTTWFGGVGGLVGTNSSWGSISVSFSTASVSGNYYVGGLVGDNSAGSVTNCYATGSVTAAQQYAGGVAGSSALSPSLVNNCYATGPVTAPSYAGGLTGSGAATGYYDQDTTGLSVGGGTPKTTEEMKQQDTYVGWDFDTIWGINPDENGGYPFLRWQGYEHQEPAATSMGYWAFDEGEGTVADDSSGNDNDGTLVGALWTADRYGADGKALEFGVNKWVNIPDTLKPNEITVCAWVYIAGTDDSATPVFSAEKGLGSTGFGYRLQITPDAKLRMEAVAPFSCSGARAVTSAGPLNLNQWYHVAGTYDGVSTKIYIDGNLAGNSSFGTYQALNTDITIPVAIGHLENWGVQWFKGKIDDARIYDSALTEAQISAIMSEV